MSTNQKLSFTLLLLAAGLGWLLVAGGKTSVSLPEAADNKTGLAEWSARLETASTVAMEETKGDEASEIPVDETEDPSETLARWVAQLGEAELIIRLQELASAELRGDPGRLLVRRWAKTDPYAASNWVAQLSDAEAREELSAAVALAWSDTHLAGALDWARALPQDRIQHRVLTDLGYEVARIDPVEALRLAVELPADDSSDGLLLHALRQWASLEPEQSQSWALQIPPSPLREHALAAVATTLASRDGSSAARFAVGNVLPGPEQDRAIIGIVQRWAQVDYNQTSDWVEQFPQIPLQAVAQETLLTIASLPAPE